MRISAKLLTATMVLAAALTACGGGNPASAPDSGSLMERSRQELVSALAERDTLLSLVKEIADGMDRIKKLENLMTVSPAKGGEKASRRQRILADIAALQRNVAQRRRQLAELEERLKKSDLYTDALQSTIAVLYRQIDSQTGEITRLRGQIDTANRQIDSLSTQVENLSTTVETISREREVAEANSEQLADELNACYFAIAGNRELKAHRILEKQFLRGAKIMKGDFDRDFFETADKRSLRSLPLHSDGARVLTNHPVESYEIVEETNGAKILRIVDPERFWSLTNYLVVETF